MNDLVLTEGVECTVHMYSVFHVPLQGGILGENVLFSIIAVKPHILTMSQ